MNTNRTILIPVLLVILGIMVWGLFFYSVPYQNEDNTKRDLTEISAESYALKKATDTLLKINKKFLENISKQVLRPIAIKVKKNKIYISDFGSMTIKSFDKKGNLLSEIGQGKGRGPGEFTNIMDFTVADSTIWAVDSQLHRISTFTLGGEFKNNFNVDQVNNRIIKSGSDLVTLMMTTSSKLFARRTKDGKVIRKFGHFLQEQSMNFPLLDGWLHSINIGNYIYVPIYGSFIFNFNRSDNVTHIVKTPHGQGFSVDEVNRKKDGDVQRMSAPKTKFENYDLETLNDKIYVYVVKRPIANEAGEILEKAKYMIDVFEISNGKYSYAYTYYLPFFVNEISLLDHYILYRKKGRIGAFKRVKAVAD